MVSDNCSSRARHQEKQLSGGSRPWSTSELGPEGDSEISPKREERKVPTGRRASGSLQAQRFRAGKAVPTLPNPLTTGTAGSTWKSPRRPRQVAKVTRVSQTRERRTPTVGRVGGGSPRSPLPSPELSCSGGQGPECGRGRVSRPEEPWCVPRPTLPYPHSAEGYSAGVSPAGSSRPPQPPVRDTSPVLRAPVPRSCDAGRPASGELSLARPLVRPVHWLVAPTNGRSESVSMRRASPWGPVSGRRGDVRLRTRTQKGGSGSWGARQLRKRERPRRRSGAGSPWGEVAAPSSVS